MDTITTIQSRSTLSGFAQPATVAPMPSEQQFQIGQWVRSKPVGKAPAFNAEIILHYADTYVVRDAVKNRWARTAEQLEPLQ